MRVSRDQHSSIGSECKLKHKTQHYNLLRSFRKEVQCKCQCVAMLKKKNENCLENFNCLEVVAHGK